MCSDDSAATTQMQLRYPRRRVVPNKGSSDSAGTKANGVGTPGVKAARAANGKARASGRQHRWLALIAYIVLVGAAVFVLPRVLRFAQMLVVLSSNANGPTGVSSATADELKTRFPNMFSVLIDVVFEPGSHWHRFCRYILPNANTAKARSYYEAQRPYFVEAARTYRLHPYFSKTRVESLEGVTYHGVITQRMAAMAQQLQEEGRDDFRIEKDRCAMYTFLQRNGFPTCKVLGMWYNETEFLEELREGDVLRGSTKWPMFLKACHLTQSSSKATRTLVDKASTLAELDDISAWIHEKWEFRANDFDRMWMADGNKLTDTVTPGFLVQEPMQQQKEWTTRGRFAIGLAEFKVEVYWGRAYLALLDGTHIFLRDGTIEDFSTPWGVLANGVANPNLLWMFEEGYMDCIWDLAERVAGATHADSMRIDIFLSEGNPGGCTVNENSLSSGMIYHGHEQWMARIWAEPLVTGSYKLLEDDTPVHMLGPN